MAASNIAQFNRLVRDKIRVTDLESLQLAEHYDISVDTKRSGSQCHWSSHKMNAANGRVAYSRELRYDFTV